MHRSGRRSRGFTLIELLVVVAIIALLIAVILPQLARAKEQGRIAVCLSNLRNISLGASMYRAEDTSRDLPWCLPFNYRVEQFSYNQLATEFAWGGGMPQVTYAQWNLATTPPSMPPNAFLGTDIIRIPPRHRPMNKYVTPNVSWDGGTRDASGAGQAREKLPMPLPGVFICPSDKSANTPLLCSSNPSSIEFDSSFKTFENWGTSYPINWYWSEYFDRAPQGVPPNAPCNTQSANALGLNLHNGGPFNGPRGQGAWMLGKNPRGGWESRFIIFYENLMNYASQGAKPQGISNLQAKVYRGWHGQPNYHVASYLDGHADYRRRDTRYVEGTGWTTWPARPYEGWNAP